MMTTKLLVAFDPQKPEQRSSDFLVVVLDGAKPKFLGVKSNKPAVSGLMVYLGREVTASNLFAKLVDTGRVIENVERTLRIMESYIQSLQGFRIGNILNVEPDSAVGFKLVKLAESPPTTKVSRLP